MSIVWTLGAYIWTACSAGWLVISYVTQIPEAFIIGLACGFMAYMFIQFGKESKNVRRK